MTSRIDECFAALTATGRKALIPFITAGDPQPQLTLPLMHALVRGGANILELGVPFSDPMADGPVIQRASERALAQGTRLRDVLDMVRQFRLTDTVTPVVLMGYANPIEAMGYAKFTAAAREAGVDGVLVVDYPPEESAEFVAAMDAQQLATIFLVSPTTPDERMQQIAKLGRGYIYYVSLKGVTGAKHLDMDEVRRRMPELRRHVDLPIGVGFGIRDPATAAAVAGVADAVVVGSRIVQEIEASTPDNMATNVERLARSLRDAIDAGAGA